MEKQRFHRFAKLIDGVHKSMSKIKLCIAPKLGVKSVHVLWLCELAAHPEGLSAAALAASSGVDRSLVSREIEVLREQGYVTVADGGRVFKKYNARLILTPAGQDLANTITSRAMDIQGATDIGVSEEELTAFYATLEKLNANLAIISEQV